MDTSVLDGHLEELRALRDTLATRYRELPTCDMRSAWQSVHDCVAEVVYEAECMECPSAATHWSIEGRYCASHAPDATSGPDEDAAYEEAAGK